MAIQRHLTRGLVLLAITAIAFNVTMAFADSPQGTPALKKKPAPNIAQSMPGCTWISQKTLFAILREDIVSANDLMTIFDRFGCPKPRLHDAFDCVVAQTLPQNVDALNAMINACWEDPTTPGAPVLAPATSTPKKPQ